MRCGIYIKIAVPPVRWTLRRAWIEIGHQKVGTAVSASKPSTTERKKKDFNGLRRRRRRDFYRGRQKIHHRTTDPTPKRGREGSGGKLRGRGGMRGWSCESDAFWSLVNPWNDRGDLWNVVSGVWWLCVSDFCFGAYSIRAYLLGRVLDKEIF